MNLRDKYRQLKFRKHWTLGADATKLIGECAGLLYAINNAPVKPATRERLLEVSLVKGAMASTAIEGNTLTEDEVSKISMGQPLPPSKGYQVQEVKNVLQAMNWLLEEFVLKSPGISERDLITPELLRDFHKRLCQDLGNVVKAVPGRWAQAQRVVGTYRPPSHEDVPELVEIFCRWMREEFRYPHKLDLETVLVHAVVAHVYFEWIHPFDDGNGRTGRLLELYILMRGGLPEIASHILSNHYNNTRPQYYAHLQDAGQSTDLSSFLFYAIQGLRDGLKEVLNQLMQDARDSVWEEVIKQTLASAGLRDKVSERLHKVVDCYVTILGREKAVKYPELKTTLTQFVPAYTKLSETMISKDIKKLLELKLLKQEQDDPYISLNLGLMHDFRTRSRRLLE